MVLRNDTARRLFPQIQPLDYVTAVRLALANLETGHVETAWSDALASSQGDLASVALATHEGIILERRQLTVAAPAPAVFAAFTRLGGTTGWLCLDWAWRLRGLLDRLLGGVGLRRGAGRRRGGFLAGGGRRAQSLAAPARRDESAGPRLAGIQS